jgi:hypothetical protein
MFGANIAEAGKKKLQMDDNGTDDTRNVSHAKTNMSFNWDKHKETDELELDDLFQEEFNKGNFTRAAWLLMRSVKNGNEENEIYLSRINKDVIALVEQEDLPGMQGYISQITKFLEERSKERKKQQTQAVILPSSSGKEHNFGEIKVN